MASKQRFVKLCLGPGGDPRKKTRRTPILGGKVVSDFVDDQDAQRYLVIECPARERKAPAAKKGKGAKQEDAVTPQATKEAWA